MFELVFGLILTVFSATMLVIVWITSGGGAIPVILFILLFVAIGLFVMWRGLKKVIANRATDKNGLPAFGLVIDVRPSGTRINDRDVLNAEVVIVEDTGVTGRYIESIGTSYNNYRVGDYVLVKYYNDDINIIAKADASNVPQEVVERFANEGYFIGQMPYGQAPYMSYGQDPYMANGQTPYMPNGQFMQNYGGGYQQGFNNGVYQEYSNGYQQNFNNGYSGNNNTDDTIVVDGVEYVRKK
ncbi:MAG: hypothetical protein IJB96_00880 [Lachnospira sp.]|nr:hypothetical protein [Lachnospira sp.]